MTSTKECFWDHCEENELDIFLAKSIIKERLTHAKKEKKRKKKKYTKMVLTKHNKLKDIRAVQITLAPLDCPKFIF